MSSCFDKQVSTCRLNHQTKPIGTNPTKKARLATVVAVIKEHFVEAALWERRANKGSLTIQKADDMRKVINVSVDEGGKLSHDYGCGNVHDGVVVAVDLSSFPPFERDAIRDKLVDEFGGNYMDPRLTGGAKPLCRLAAYGGDHVFDIVFLPPGPCEYEVDERAVETEMKALVRGHGEPGDGWHNSTECVSAAPQ